MPVAEGSGSPQHGLGEQREQLVRELAEADTRIVLAQSVWDEKRRQLAEIDAGILTAGRRVIPQYGVIDADRWAADSGVDGGKRDALIEEVNHLQAVRKAFVDEEEWPAQRAYNAVVVAADKLRQDLHRLDGRIEQAQAEEQKVAAAPVKVSRLEQARASLARLGLRS